jgi:hypothetical protein
MSEENKSRALTHKQITEYEEILGFRPSGTNNFWCTYFNTSTGEREIIGDGALSIDEFITEKVFIEFLNDFIKDTNKNNVYIFSVIINSTNIHNLAILKNNIYPKDKIKALKDAYNKYCNIFDILYGIFIGDGNGSRQKPALYRNDVKTNVLFLSSKLYKQRKKEIEQILLDYEKKHKLDNREERVNSD